MVSSLVDSLLFVYSWGAPLAVLYFTNPSPAVLTNALDQAYHSSNSAFISSISPVKRPLPNQLDMTTLEDYLLFRVVTTSTGDAYYGVAGVWCNNAFFLHSLCGCLCLTMALGYACNMGYRYLVSPMLQATGSRNCNGGGYYSGMLNEGVILLRKLCVPPRLTQLTHTFILLFTFGFPLELNFNALMCQRRGHRSHGAVGGSYNRCSSSYGEAGTAQWWGDAVSNIYRMVHEGRVGSVQGQEDSVTAFLLDSIHSFGFLVLLLAFAVHVTVLYIASNTGNTSTNSEKMLSSHLQRPQCQRCTLTGVALGLTMLYGSMLISSAAVAAASPSGWLDRLFSGSVGLTGSIAGGSSSDISSETNHLSWNGYRIELQAVASSEPSWYSTSQPTNNFLLPQVLLGILLYSCLCTVSDRNMQNGDATCIVGCCLGFAMSHFY